MAGEKINIKGRLRSSTVLEVIVAMVVILVVFGIALSIYQNVTRMSLSVEKLKAQALLQKVMIQAERSGAASSTMNIDSNFKIEVEAGNYRNDTLLLQVHLTAFDVNRVKLAELQKVIIKK